MAHCDGIHHVQSREVNVLAMSPRMLEHVTKTRPALRRDMTAPRTRTALHDHYVRAINCALEAGHEQDALELAAAYSDDLNASETLQSLTV